MQNANHIVIESNIASADPRNFRESDALTIREMNEFSNLNEWLELQEEAEMQLITMELVGRNNANARNARNAQRRLLRDYHAD